MEKPSPIRSPLFRFLRWAFINLAVTVGLLALIEGGASFIMAHRLIEEVEPADRQGEVAERRHTEYDPLLGWINLPDLVISNMYGEGRHLTTNGDRMRHREEAPGSNQLRVIASGDSFTFGYGVGDDQTWAEQLEDLDPRLDILNMGLGGYGFGQAYLWYQRDGRDRPHDLHLFCFITENFRRLTRDRFMGYGKPVLTARDGQLVVDNVPPPERRASLSATRFTKAIMDLDIVRLFTERAEQKQASRQKAWNQKGEETVLLAFSELQRVHQEAGRPWALVHLPTERDYSDGDSNGWRNWLAQEATARGWIFLDLVRELRRLPKDQIAGLFIQADEGRYRGSKGHYTEAGNAWVAGVLSRKLAEHPQLIQLPPKEALAKAENAAL